MPDVKETLRTMAKGTDTRFTMDYQGEGYPGKWDGGIYPGRKNVAQTYPWATDSKSMEELTIGWVLNHMMAERGITHTEIATHLGISKQRLTQMMHTLLSNAERSYERIERAITELTDAKGGVYAAIGYSETDSDKMQKEVDEWLLLA